MRLNHDLAAGLFFWAFALVYGAMAWTSLPVGTSLNMGPGYFPIVLSGLLLLIGAVEIARAFSRRSPGGLGDVSWRAIALLVAAIVFFATTVQGLGILPATFVTAALSCFASREAKPIPALVTGASLAVFCTLVFGYGVSLPLPVVGPWLGG